MQKIVPQHQVEQDPVSSMQKTGWTIHSSFLVLSGLEKGFTLDVFTSRGQSTTISLCIGPLSAWWRQTNERTNKQPGDPSASLFLTGEKAVFCNFSALYLQWRIIPSRQCIATPCNLAIFPITSFSSASACLLFLYSFLPDTGTWLVDCGTGHWVLGQYRVVLLGAWWYWVCIGRYWLIISDTAVSITWSCLV